MNPPRGAEALSLTRVEPQTAPRAARMFVAEFREFLAALGPAFAPALSLLDAAGPAFSDIAGSAIRDGIVGVISDVVPASWQTTAQDPLSDTVVGTWIVPGGGVARLLRQWPTGHSDALFVGDLSLNGAPVPAVVAGPGDNVRDTLVELVRVAEQSRRTPTPAPAETVEQPEPGQGDYAPDEYEVQYGTDLTGQMRRAAAKTVSNFLLRHGFWNYKPVTATWGVHSGRPYEWLFTWGAPSGAKFTTAMRYNEGADEYVRDASKFEFPDRSSVALTDAEREGVQVEDLQEPHLYFPHGALARIPRRGGGADTTQAPFPESLTALSPTVSRLLKLLKQGSVEEWMRRSGPRDKLVVRREGMMPLVFRWTWLCPGEAQRVSPKGPPPRALFFCHHTDDGDRQVDTAAVLFIQDSGHVAGKVVAYAWGTSGGDEALFRMWIGNLRDQSWVEAMQRAVEEWEPRSEEKQGWTFTSKGARLLQQVAAESEQRAVTEDTLKWESHTGSAESQRAGLESYRAYAHGWTYRLEQVEDDDRVQWWLLSRFKDGEYVYLGVGEVPGGIVERRPGVNFDRIGEGPARGPLAVPELLNSYGMARHVAETDASRLAAAPAVPTALRDRWVRVDTRAASAFPNPPPSWVWTIRPGVAYRVDMIMTAPHEPGPMRLKGYSVTYQNGGRTESLGPVADIVSVESVVDTHAAAQSSVVHEVGAYFMHDHRKVAFLGQSPNGDVSWWHPVTGISKMGVATLRWSPAATADLDVSGPEYTEVAGELAFVNGHGTDPVNISTLRRRKQWFDFLVQALPALPMDGLDVRGFVAAEAAQYLTPFPGYTLMVSPELALSRLGDGHWPVDRSHWLGGDRSRLVDVIFPPPTFPEELLTPPDTGADTRPGLPPRALSGFRKILGEVSDALLSAQPDGRMYGVGFSLTDLREKLSLLNDTIETYGARLVNALSDEDRLLLERVRNGVAEEVAKHLTPLAGAPLPPETVGQGARVREGSPDGPIVEILLRMEQTRVSLREQKAARRYTWEVRGSDGRQRSSDGPFYAVVFTEADARALTERVLSEYAGASADYGMKVPTIASIGPLGDMEAGILARSGIHAGFLVTLHNRGKMLGRLEDALERAGMGDTFRVRYHIEDTTPKVTAPTAPPAAPTVRDDNPHWIRRGDKVYADTNALRAADKIDGVTIDHVGFGDFKARTPHGEVYFMRADSDDGKYDIPGQVGRPHELSGPAAAIEALVAGWEAQVPTAAPVAPAAAPDPNALPPVDIPGVTLSVRRPYESPSETSTGSAPTFDVNRDGRSVGYIVPPFEGETTWTAFGLAARPPHPMIGDEYASATAAARAVAEAVVGRPRVSVTSGRFTLGGAPARGTVDVQQDEAERRARVLDALVALGWQRYGGTVELEIGGGERGGELNPAGRRVVSIGFSRTGQVEARVNNGMDGHTVLASVYNRHQNGAEPETAREIDAAVRALDSEPAAVSRRGDLHVGDKIRIVRGLNQGEVGVVTEVGEALTVQGLYGGGAEEQVPIRVWFANGGERSLGSTETFAITERAPAPASPPALPASPPMSRRDLDEFGIGGMVREVTPSTAGLPTHFAKIGRDRWRTIGAARRSDGSVKSAVATPPDLTSVDLARDDGVTFATGALGPGAPDDWTETYQRALDNLAKARVEAEKIVAPAPALGWTPFERRSVTTSVSYPTIGNVTIQTLGLGVSYALWRNEDGRGSGNFYYDVVVAVKDLPVELEGSVTGGYLTTDGAVISSEGADENPERTRFDYPESAILATEDHNRRVRAMLSEARGEIQRVADERRREEAERAQREAEAHRPAADDIRRGADGAMPHTPTTAKAWARTWLARQGLSVGKISAKSTNFGDFGSGTRIVVTIDGPGVGASVRQAMAAAAKAQRAGSGTGAVTVGVDWTGMPPDEAPSQDVSAPAAGGLPPLSQWTRGEYSSVVSSAEYAPYHHIDETGRYTINAVRQRGVQVSADKRGGIGFSRGPGPAVLWGASWETVGESPRRWKTVIDAQDNRTTGVETPEEARAALVAFRATLLGTTAAPVDNPARVSKTVETKAGRFTFSRIGEDVIYVYLNGTKLMQAHKGGVRHGYQIIDYVPLDDRHLDGEGAKTVLKRRGDKSIPLAPEVFAEIKRLLGVRDGPVAEEPAAPPVAVDDATMLARFKALLKEVV